MTDFVSTWNNDLLTVPFAPLGLIAMPGCEELGQKVNNWLMKWYEQQEALEDTPLFSLMGANRHDFLIEAHCPRFGTGEGKGMIKSSVRGYDIYILTDIGAYNVTYKMYGREVPMSPDDHYADLKRIIAAMGGKAKSITVVMPMLYGGRQHRRNARESLDCAQMLQELQMMGVKEVITFDAHDPRVQNAVPMMGFDNFMPTYQILKALLEKYPDVNMNKDNFMIVSPDEGAMGRNIYYASVLGTDLGMFYKRRDYANVVNGRNPIIAHDYIGNDVSGKDIFVADDIIATGDSMLKLCVELKERGADKIFLTSTYALFTEGVQKFRDAYEQGLFTAVISTNLTYAPPELLAESWFVQADMSKFMAYIMAACNQDYSVSTLLDPHDKIHELIEAYNKCRPQQLAIKIEE